jgi:hypothetical protein
MRGVFLQLWMMPRLAMAAAIMAALHGMPCKIK